MSEERSHILGNTLREGEKIDTISYDTELQPSDVSLVETRETRFSSPSHSRQEDEKRQFKASQSRLRFIFLRWAS